MQVQVRLGSGLSRLSGTARVSLELADDATVADLLLRLGESNPVLAPGLDSALTVVRGTQVTRARRLVDGEEVSLLLPVAGGAPQLATRPKGVRRWQ